MTSENGLNPDLVCLVCILVLGMAMTYVEFSGKR